MRYVFGIVLIYVGLAVQGVGWLFSRAGWLIECAGNGIGEDDH